jgi:hypothetical protein
MGDFQDPLNSHRPSGDGVSAWDRATLILDCDEFRSDLKRKVYLTCCQALRREDEQFVSYLSNFVERALRSEQIMPRSPRPPEVFLDVSEASELGRRSDAFSNPAVQAQFNARTGEYAMFVLAFPDAPWCARHADTVGLSAERITKIGQSCFDRASRLIYSQDEELSSLWRHVMKWFPMYAEMSASIFSQLLVRK